MLRDAVVNEQRPLNNSTRVRQVTQLLKDYRAWHTPYGGGLSLDDSHMRSAEYGPAAFVEVGAYFPRKVRPALAVSFEKLEHAITLLKHSPDRVDRLCYYVLLTPYLSDPADPSIVAHWRKHKPELAKWHDLAVRKLARRLASHDLFVVWPKRMTSNEEKRIEERNDELYRLYSALTSEGVTKSKAIKDAALMCGYSERRAWEIVAARESATTRDT